jgi:hypothetical protein
MTSTEHRPLADRTPGWTAYGVGLVVALALGHFLFGMPIQVSDSFGNMLQLSISWSDLLHQKFTQPGFLRPLLWGELKLVYDLSGGNYTAWFRGIHVAQVTALTVLIVALVRARSWRDVACLPLAFAVLLGIHTFSGLVTEAFPTNMYLTVVILCVAAAVVALAPHRRWSDAIAVVLFAAAALTLETGLLVWVICIGAALLGARGISRIGLVLLTVLLGAYFYARFVLLGVGSPNLLERSSGFGFGVLDPPELVERFGANPLPFYLYNVVTSFISVLVSEPTAGVFRLVHAVSTGNLSPAQIVNPVASLGLVGLLGWFAWTRRGRWLAWRFEHDDRLVLLFGMVLTANAAISYPYTKDVILGPAGVFLAVAAAAAGRHLVAAIPVRLPPLRAVALVAAICVLTCAWSLRALRLFGQLRSAAITERLDWAYIESDIADGVVHVSSPDARQLMEHLRHEALVAHPAPPPLELPFRGSQGY